METRLTETLERTTETGRYLTAMFRHEEGRVKLERTTQDFPLSDQAAAIGLLMRDLGVTLQDLRAWLKKHPPRKN